MKHNKEYTEQEIKIYRQIINYIKAYIETNHDNLIDAFKKYKNSTDENDLMLRLFNYKLQKYKIKDDNIINYANNTFLGEFIENYFIDYLKTLKNIHKIDELEINKNEIKIKYK